jgi:hypothetical protein
VALLRALTAGGFVALTCAATVSLGCSTREVFLVPLGSEEDAATVKADAGSPPPDAHEAPEESGTSLNPKGRDAGDSGPRCETNRYTEVPQPLGVYLMVDQSVPMHDPWNSVVTALKDFIAESGTLNDVSMGIQYFAVSPTSGTEPLDDWLRTACSAVTYSTPDVPIESLPGNQPALITSLGQHNPSNTWPPNLPLGIFESPTDRALAGAIDGLRAWAASKNKPKLAVVLVTDGVPNFSLSQNCNAASLTGTQQAAKDGVSATPGVVTYVLGVGDRLDPLNQIAQSGGTEHAYLVASTAAPNDILVQLQSIRDVALPCEISVDGAHLAQGDVNVELATGAVSEFLSRVSDASGCADGATARQWFADQPDAGGSVVLCPATCAAIRSTKNATLDVVYGCPTVFAK